MHLEAGSFRDRHARVFYDERGRVLRGLSPHALEQWQALAATQFFRDAVAAGRIVRSERIDETHGDWAAVLEHERLPFVSYPYEWCFGMLRDAALLQLELMQSALREGMILKDATPYNIQWRGGRPLFIDVVSFERLAPGEPWAGYRQFCQLFLYPLFLQAYRDVPFQPWLRGSLEGIEAHDCRNLLRPRDLLRPGVLKHVWLQAMAPAGVQDRDVKSELKQAGFHAELIAANLRGLEKVVRSLQWKPAPSAWSGYAESKPYDDAEGAAKQEFVRWAVARRRRARVWDLGCNTGEFSRLAAESGAFVVAIDADHPAVERLYAGVRESDRILPLVVPLTDPSPSRGWRLRERLDLASRGAPDLTLCLALVHHLVIGANIPLAELMEWLATLGGDLVIEFVAKDDPMVRRLLRNKADVYEDYGREHFERCLEKTHEIEGRAEIGGGRRVLYYAAARGRSE